MQMSEMDRRHRYILNILAQYQSARISALEKELGVSRETIRRDLKTLEQRGMLKCVHGGAVFNPRATHKYEVTQHRARCLAEKKTIAFAASDLIDDHDALLISGTTTTHCLGPYLAQKNSLTVITNSVYLAECAIENTTNSAILLGGNYNNDEQKTMGAQMCEMLSHYRVDKALISASGISSVHGLTDYGQDDCQFLRQAVAIAKQTVALMDYTKFSVAALARVCGIEDLNCVVTDWNTITSEIMALRQQGVKVVQAMRMQICTPE